MAMKFRNRSFLFLCLFTGCFIFLLAGDQEGNLATVYRSGKVLLVPEVMIDAKALPKDVFFVGLVAISCDSQGNVYALDQSDRNIKKFDSSGKFIKVIGRKGQGPGEFSLPTAMAVAGDRLVVHDQTNNSFILLDLEGRFVKNVMLSDMKARTRKLGSLPDGSVVMETEKMNFSPENKPYEYKINILGPNLEREKEIFFQEINISKLITTPDGMLAPLYQPFCPDIYWDISPEGKILIGFSEKYEIGIYAPMKGKISTVTHARDYTKILDEDKKQWFANMAVDGGNGVQKGAPDFYVKATKFPRFKPAFDALFWDPEGNILVHPILESRFINVFDAFNPKGEFIARVEFAGAPESFHHNYSKAFVSDGVWVIEYDSDGNCKIVKYRFSR